jgi:hypothetical protein
MMKVMKAAPTPAHRPTDRTRKEVERLAALRVPPADIARLLHVRPEDLQAVYGEQLVLGRAKGDLQIFEAGYKRALAGDLSAVKLRIRVKDDEPSDDASHARREELTARVENILQRREAAARADERAKVLAELAQASRVPARSSPASTAPSAPSRDRKEPRRTPRGGEPRFSG